MTQTFDKTTQHNAVGRATRRQDAPDKLTGRTRYAGDVSVAGMLHARLVLSPYAHARILSIDTSAAEAIPGVRAVYTRETLGMAKRETSSRTQSPLAHKEALWSGHPVAIVLAETEAAAEDGVAVVDVEYEVLPAVMDPVAAVQPGSPLARIQEKDTTSEIAGGGAPAAVAAEGGVGPRKESLCQKVNGKAPCHSRAKAAGRRRAA